MIIDDIIYFSKNYKTTNLNLENVEELLNAFTDRIEEFYLKPAEKLNGEFESFAKGVLILTAIDFIGEFFIRTSNSHRIKKFCEGLESIAGKEPDEVEKITNIINDHYRNGLIHEGRIKNLGQFSLDADRLIEYYDSYSLINPEIFLEETRSRFYEIVNSVKSSQEDMYQFKNRFKSHFKPEIDALHNK